ncbi:PQQ-dependent sugar dehydrogenase [Spirosoma montaniterrae]|uniref:PA14 domain-containing protein n=1 Tax=Spirosoma montaniterrae TaxID=1178516 RepID=A0A1P9X256_9BACT|nr:PQQ-dependent sugar dehydrogenase [Spirosoma montaniterrae]AQG81716.1 hypothetical protein AWR27_21880 [Spirosoma montaniterrae]
MRSIYLFVLLGCALLSQAQVPAGFVQRQIARNLNPTTLTFSPDGRLFVVEKDGDVREIIDDVLAPDPFLTVGNVDVSNERGLSGLCFHPDFPRTPYLYAYYTVKGRNANRLSRFTVSGSTANPQSETVLMEFDQLVGSIHNAGAMRFGNDRKLYVTIGDGGSPGSAQSMTSLLGKILRLNDDGSIPADNPFYNQVSGQLRAIYALGFRNPFSMDIDRASGRIFVGDVGGSNFEEVNEVLAGRNYGWPIIEGRRNGQTAPANYQDPMYSYDHNTGCAVTGVAFYNPATVRFPAAYQGKFFFADYCRGTIQMLDPQTGRLISDFVTGIDRPVAIVVSPDGYLYYAARAGLGGGSSQDNTSTWNGAVHKVSYFDSGKPYITNQSTNVLVPVGEATTFTVEAVGQKPMTYRWFRNDRLISETNQNTFTISSPALGDNGAVFRCVVVNALGTDESTPMTLRVVQGQRPVARIRQPATNATYRAGGVINFAGDALDASQKPLSGAKLTWWINFHHDDHTHPALSPTTGSVSTGSYTIPRSGETSTNVWYRVHLRATDVSGLFSETHVDVKPELALVTVASNPSLADLYLDGEPHQAGFTFESVVGTIRTLETRPYRATADGFAKFLGWNSQLKTSRVDYEIPAQNATLTMTYEMLPSSGGNGLWAEYYASTDEFKELPTLVRIDPTVNFDWGDKGPRGVGDDKFVARWTGKVLAPFTDTYTFYVQSDDGVRLWVDDKLLIDKWIFQPETEWSARIDLVAGRQYNIRMEYLENQGAAVSRLLWSTLTQFDKAIVSKGQLFAVQVITATEPVAEASLTVFPVPAREQATVRYEATAASPAQLDVIDLLGRAVFSRSVRVLPGTNEYVIPVSEWPTGLYTVALKTENGKVVNRRLLVR